MAGPNYVPLALMTLLTASLITLISGNLVLIMTNPDTYLEPAVESAAEDIAHVCSGNFKSTTLAPAPPGSSYQIERCLERNVALSTSTIMAALQFMNIGGDDTKKVIDGAKDTGEAMTDSAKILNKVTSGDTIELTDEVLDVLQDLKKYDDEALDAMSDLARKTDRIDGSGEFADSLDDFSKKLDDTKLDDLEPGKTLNCLDDDDKVICDQLRDLSNSVSDLGPKSLRYSKEMSSFANKVTRASKISRSMKSEARSFSKIGKTSRELIYSFDDIGNSYKLFKKAAVVIGPGGARRLQGVYRYAGTVLKNLALYKRRLVYSKIHNLVEDVVLEANSIQLTSYLFDHENIFDLIALPSTGVPYSQMVVNVLNSTDESVNELAKKGMNITGNFTQFSMDFKKNVTNTLAQNGYYLTSSYIADLSTYDIISYDATTNINSLIFFRVTSEFLENMEYACDNDPCVDYALEIFEVAKNITTGETTLVDLENYANIDIQGIESEQDIFREVLAFFINADKEAGKLVTMAENFQKNDVASWMRNECGTTMLNLEKIGNVEVSDCGLVVDCSPGTFCYLGAAVVSSDPWTPYIPITVATGADAGSLGEIVGLNYDSSEKVLDPISFLGACGLTNPLQSLFICASTTDNQRCKIVNCGKDITLLKDNLRLSVDVEAFDDFVEIRGNFLEW